MAAVIAPPDDDEPSNEAEGVTPDEPELTVQLPASDPERRRRVRIRVLDEDGQPWNVKGFTGVPTGRIFSDEVMRSISASLAQHWVTPQMKESLSLGSRPT